MKVEKLQERLKLREFKLNTLLEVTRAINSNQSAATFFSKYQEIMQNELQIGRLVLFSHTGGAWKCVIQYGVDQDYAHVDVEKSFDGITDIEYIQSHQDPFFNGFGSVIPVFHKSEPLAYLLIGDLNDDEIRMSPIIKHVRFVQTLTNIIVVAIENKLLAQKGLEQERTRTELALAAEMQALMVGSGSKTLGDVEVATYYKPHQQVGGDFCDYIHLDDENSFFCVADVSGKGMSAAFIMANIQAYLRALLEYTDWSLESIATELNKKVVDTVHGDRFVTLFMGHFHKPSRKLKYLNAGHNPPILLNGGKTYNLEDGTVGIGMLEMLPFINTNDAILKPDAVVICFTDGVVEIENDQGEEYGTERMSELLLQKAATIDHVDDLISQIVHSVDMHRGTNPYFDDTALLCCRFK